MTHGVPKIRKALFWDSDFDKIDWNSYRDAVITRVLDRGNQTEKQEIAKFYNIPTKDLDKYRLNQGH